MRSVLITVLDGVYMRFCVPVATVLLATLLAPTARDYSRFLQMMLNGGELDGVRVLSPVTVELMTSDHSARGRGDRRGDWQ